MNKQVSNNNKKFSYKPDNKDKYNNDYYIHADNTYDDMVSEECSICGKELTKTKDIFVDTECDRYVCKSCGQKHRLHIAPCIELE